MSIGKRAELHSVLRRDLRQFIANAILNNQRIADSLGLHLTDLQCFGVLELMGHSTPGRLAEFTGLSTGGVTVMLDRLQKAGYIKRVPNPDDRRSVLIQINPKQFAKLKPYYGELTERLELLYSSMTIAELEVVTAFFSRMDAGVRERSGVPGSEGKQNARAKYRDPSLRSG
jgi:DNA-binding MarR family transcriptional regulator